MLQTHIGYTGWQQPDAQAMPSVKRVTATDSAKKMVFASPQDKAANASQADVIAIEAPHYSRAIGGKGLIWRTIPTSVARWEQSSHCPKAMYLRQ